MKLLTFIENIEQALGRSATKNLLPMQPGDVPVTAADIEDLQATTGFSPSTALKDGIANYAAWFREYYKM